jgi:hypothetical protein
MQEMYRVNIRQNLQVVVQIATKYSDLLGPAMFLELYESFKSFEGNAHTSLLPIEAHFVQASITTLVLW